MYQKNVKTIDLGAFIEKYLEVILADGTTVHLRRPTKKIAMMLENLRTLQDEPENMRIAVIDMLFDALNNNAEHRTFTIDEVTAMPDIMLSALLNAYSDFIIELINNPNS